jgi:hypothetical protein
MQTVTNCRPAFKINYYASGVKLCAGGRFVAGKHKRALRGEIKGWSKASRNRMRRFMLEYAPPEGWKTYGVTLTIPGPTMPDDKEKAIFAWWAREVERKGWACVWRLEVQTRGSRHWHCIASLPPDRLPYEINLLWWAALDSIGPQDFNPPHVVGSMEISHIKRLSNLPGADRRSCDVQKDGGSGAWKRYLQDHASKAKQEQTAGSKGRQWGIVGRKLYSPQLPYKTDTLTDSQYYFFLRMYQRLCTPSRPAACVFGRKLGYRPSVGRRGESVRFSRSDTVDRISRYARGL